MNENTQTKIQRTPEQRAAILDAWRIYCEKRAIVDVYWDERRDPTRPEVGKAVREQDAAWDRFAELAGERPDC